MLQGDSYKIPFNITFSDTAITPTDISDVEIAIGRYIKTYANNEVTYEDSVWYFPVSQEETFAFSGQKQSVQVRVLFPSGDVYGISLGTLKVDRSISREILGE